MRRQLGRALKRAPRAEKKAAAPTCADLEDIILKLDCNFATRCSLSESQKHFPLRLVVKRIFHDHSANIKLSLYILYRIATDLLLIVLFCILKPAEFK